MTLRTRHYGLIALCGALALLICGRPANAQTIYRPGQPSIDGTNVIYLLGQKADLMHTHSASDITSGFLVHTVFDAYGNLLYHNRVGTNLDQVAPGIHTHDFSDITGTIPPHIFDAYDNLALNDKIGTNANQVASGTHVHIDYENMFVAVASNYSDLAQALVDEITRAQLAEGALSTAISGWAETNALAISEMSGRVMGLESATGLWNTVTSRVFQSQYDNDIGIINSNAAIMSGSLVMHGMRLGVLEGMTNLSDYNNDAGYITNAGVTALNSLTGDITFEDGTNTKVRIDGQKIYIDSEASGSGDAETWYEYEQKDLVWRQINVSSNINNTGWEVQGAHYTAAGGYWEDYELDADEDWFYYPDSRAPYVLWDEQEDSNPFSATYKIWGNYQIVLPAGTTITGVELAHTAWIFQKGLGYVTGNVFYVVGDKTSEVYSVSSSRYNNGATNIVCGGTNDLMGLTPSDFAGQISSMRVEFQLSVAGEYHDNGYDPAAYISFLWFAFSNLAAKLYYVFDEDIAYISHSYGLDSQGDFVIDYDGIKRYPLQELDAIDVPTKVSGLENDKGYITNVTYGITSNTAYRGDLGNAVSGRVSSIESQTNVWNSALQPGDIVLPTNVSALANDAGYITNAGVTSLNSLTGNLNLADGSNTSIRVDGTSIHVDASGFVTLDEVKSASPLMINKTAVQIGSEASAAPGGGVAVGRNTVAGPSAVAVGDNAQATGTSVAIGWGVENEESNTTMLQGTLNMADYGIKNLASLSLTNGSVIQGYGTSSTTAYRGDCGNAVSNLAQGALPKSGGTMTGNIQMGGNNILGIGKSVSSNASYVVVRLTNNLSIAVTTHVYIAFNDIIHDNLGEWSGSTFTAKNAGVYLVNLAILWKNTESGKIFYSYLLGGVFTRYLIYASAVNASEYPTFASDAIVLGAGDVIRARVYHNASGAKIISGAGGSDLVTWMSIVKILDL